MGVMGTLGKRPQTNRRSQGPRMGDGGPWAPVAAKRWGQGRVFGSHNTLCVLPSSAPSFSPFKASAAQRQPLPWPRPRPGCSAPPALGFVRPPAAPRTFPAVPP